MVASYLIQIMTLVQVPISFQPCFLEQGTPTAIPPFDLLAVILLIMTWRTLGETKEEPDAIFEKSSVGDPLFLYSCDHFCLCPLIIPVS